MYARVQKKAGMRTAPITTKITTISPADIPPLGADGSPLPACVGLSHGSRPGVYLGGNACAGAWLRSASSQCGPLNPTPQRHPGCLQEREAKEQTEKRWLEVGTFFKSWRNSRYSDQIELTVLQGQPCLCTHHHSNKTTGVAQDLACSRCKSH